MGLAEFVCDELHWAMRETLRGAGQDELSLARLVHRRHAVRDVLRPASRLGRCATRCC